MAVKSKKPNPQKVKPAKKQRPQESEEEEDEEDVEDELDESGEGEDEVDSDVEGEEEESDEEEGDEEEGEEEDGESGEEEAESDEEEEEKAEVKVKPVAKTKATKVKEQPAKKSAVKEDTSNDPETSTTIFVGHLKYKIDKKALTDFFSGAGEIESIRLIQRKGYAFVQFAKADSVEKALKLDKKPLDGRAVHVERSKSKKSSEKKEAGVKRRLEQGQDDGQPKAKKAKEGGKVVNLKKSFKPKGKGKPKTPQQSNPNKKKNKPKPGQFVKAK